MEKYKKSNYEFDESEVERFSQIFIHELGHNRVLHHDEMLGSWKIDCKWARDFKVNIRENKPKIKRDLKQDRYDNAKNKVKELMTKIKRNNTLLKKWEKKVRYYENSCS